MITTEQRDQLIAAIEAGDLTNTRAYHYGTQVTVEEVYPRYALVQRLDDGGRHLCDLSELAVRP